MVAQVKSVRTQQPHEPEALGCDKWRPLIEKYGWDKRIAMAVMEAESTETIGGIKVPCSQSAVGDKEPIAGLLAESCGLFQIRTLAGRPSCEELKNPETNVEWAYKLYIGDGWHPWSMYNNGTYQQYLR